ncbi:MAG TPA: cyclic nucleotide-binding domain-containing protein [Rubrobacter sp.]|nr:cyclic nucleotide-binding domain-containing protein [Rubrobacter sp.]
MAAVKEPGSEDMTVSPERRLELLAGVPAFSHLPDPVLEDLASRLTEERFRPADRVVVEGDTDDRLYLIVEGRAEASTIGSSGIVPLATLGPGELFGELSVLEAGSSRQATVTAVEPLLLLSLRATDFRLALDAHPEGRAAFEKLADDLLVTKLLKQASPFSTLDGERLRRLAARLERLEVPTGETIIRQGEAGEECYVLRSGRVEVLTSGAQGDERILATLDPGSLFGEAALLTDGLRNATVRALKPSTLLLLRRTDLLEVLGEDRQTRERMLELVRMRDRPRRVRGIEVHHRTTITGETITTLKDARRDTNHRLSPAGWFVWQRLDGEHTLRDLTSEYMATHEASASHAVVEAVVGLVAAGFVEGVKPSPEVIAEEPTLWQRVRAAVRRILE